MRGAGMSSSSSGANSGSGSGSNSGSGSGSNSGSGGDGEASTGSSAGSSRAGVRSSSSIGSPYNKVGWRPSDRPLGLERGCERDFERGCWLGARHRSAGRRLEHGPRRRARQQARRRDSVGCRRGRGRHPRSRRSRWLALGRQLALERLRPLERQHGVALWHHRRASLGRELGQTCLAGDEDLQVLDRVLERHALIGWDLGMNRDLNVAEVATQRHRPAEIEQLLGQRVPGSLDTGLEQRDRNRIAAVRQPELLVELRRRHEVQLEQHRVERAAVDLLAAHRGLEPLFFDRSRRAKLLQQLAHADLTT